MKLKELRTQRGLSQKEMGEIFNLSQKVYANYEIEKNKPNYITLKKIADYFNVSVDYLINHETKNTLEIGHLSDIKKELINLIYSATDNDCKMLEAYYLGMQEAKNQNTYNNLLKKEEVNE